VAVSLDGATTGFEPDVGRFYALAARWREDVTLAGADTILAQAGAVAGAPKPGPAADGPLLAVIDGRERVDPELAGALRELGHWSGVRVLRAAPGPRHVDLEAALESLGGGVVRVDSGGALNGALLTARLVDEASLLVHPVLVGEAPRWHGGATASLALEAHEALGHGVVWLRYALTRS
jgi:2,5-diamino-6-(ribosylamino)-4(3H)-pyrimidinone 5'-phosphate reductase